MSAETDNKFIWKQRLDNTKWILTLLIVFYHIPVPENASGLQNTVLLYAKDLGDCVVPSFALISGFLFFYNVHNISDIYQKMKRRLWTLLIPYMMWNIINSLYLILCRNGISDFLKGIITANWIKNIILWGGTTPHFWYIFMLIFWTVLSPLLFFAYKDKRLLAVLLLSQAIYFIYKGPNILASRHTYILYTWGGYLGCLFPNLFEKIGLSDVKRKTTFYICLIIFIVIRLPYNNITNNGILCIGYGVRSIFLILALMNAPYEYIGVKTNYVFSFWTFAIHYYLDAIISTYVCKWVPTSAVQIVSLVIVIILAITSGTILKYICPKLFLLLIGNRTK